MSGKVLSFELPDYTLNADSGDGFLCLLCAHYTFVNETSWAETFHDKAVTNTTMIHMHGTEDFHYCPNCGAEVLSLGEWVERRPQDQDKTLSEIKRTIRELR